MTLIKPTLSIFEPPRQCSDSLRDYGEHISLPRSLAEVDNLNDAQHISPGESGFMTCRGTLLALLDKGERDQHISEVGLPQPVLSTTRSWHAMARLNSLKKS